MDGLGLASLPGGLDQLALVEPYPVFSAVSAITPTAQFAYVVLVIVPSAVTVTKLSAYTTGTGINLDLAILDEAYDKLVGITAPVASVANGDTTGTLTAAFTYQPGVIYRHVVVSDSNAANIRGVSSLTGAQLTRGSITRAAAKNVGQNTVPASVSSPSATTVAPHIVGHN